jgi:hypothetical protein
MIVRNTQRVEPDIESNRQIRIEPNNQWNPEGIARCCKPSLISTNGDELSSSDLHFSKRRTISIDVVS